MMYLALYSGNAAPQLILDHLSCPPSCRSSWLGWAEVDGELGGCLSSLVAWWIGGCWLLRTVLPSHADCLLIFLPYAQVLVLRYNRRIGSGRACGGSVPAARRGGGIRSEHFLPNNLNLGDFFISSTYMQSRVTMHVAIIIYFL